MSQALIQEIQAPVSFGEEECKRLARRYHPGDVTVASAANEYSPERFLRLFLTAHGMAPVGNWQTHTYARVTDSLSLRDHFFLIPIPFRRRKQDSQTADETRPTIRLMNGEIWIDEIRTAVRAQSIPHTTPFWYFHYDPNREQTPFDSMTVNFKPACPEKCTLCAGAKTGRVNNGLEGSLATEHSFGRIFNQHPQAREQLDSVAVVTGCFDQFDDLASHLRDVRQSVLKFASPSTFRVLEHNVTTEAQYEIVVGELGYDVFITLECFDQSMRKIALNGNVGRKGRDSRQFLDMIQNYANYLDARPELGKHLVHVTYLIGIDSLETTEYLFSLMAEMNRKLKHTTIVPWLSVFTPYDETMRIIQNREFSLGFIIDAQFLAERYFGAALMERESGSTADGYARGLF